MNGRIAYAAALMLVCVYPALADDRLVPSQYTTIQAAINDCNTGDVVIIAPGTYTGTDNWDIGFLGKSITVRSTDPDDPCVVANTIMDGGGDKWECHCGFYFQSGEGPNSILAGLTIKRFHQLWGSGIRCNGASPTIRNCAIIDNKAENFLDIDVLACGAGIAVVNGSEPTITNCRIERNSVEAVVGYPLSTDADGGGVYGDNTSTVTLYDCIVVDNVAKGGQDYRIDPPGILIYPHYSKGGGIYINNGTINNCLIAGNFAYPVYGENQTQGGYWIPSEGAGVYDSSGTIITNCTIYDNNGQPEGHGPANGGGLYGNAQVTNCIIWANIASNQIQGSPNVTYSDVQGGYAGTANINADPCFASGPQGDYYLSQIVSGQTVNSPCVDIGSNTAANLGMDLKTTRTDEVADEGIVNIGYHYPVFIGIGSPDLNGDAFVDFIDYTIFADDWELPPDPCDPNSGDILKDGHVDINDLALLVNDWLTCFVTESTGPEPMDNAINVNRNIVLQWSPGIIRWSSGENGASHDVFFGTDFNEVQDADMTNPTVYMGNEDANYWDINNYDSNGLEADTTYYWRIDEMGPVCSAKGNVWSFTTIVQLPGQAGNPIPGNGATDVNITTDLIWTAGSGSTSHDVYFGTTNPPPFVVNQAGTTYDTGTMGTNTTYYWRIDEKNAGGTTTGDVWSFTTVPLLPGQASNPAPSDGATNVSVTTDISWTPGEYAGNYVAGKSGDGHHVFFHTNQSWVEGANLNYPLGTAYGHYQADTNQWSPIDPVFGMGASLQLFTTYYWLVIEVNSVTVGSPWKGPVWSFTTIPPPPPGQASNPNPVNGATDVNITTDLSWTAGSGATSHDVYFGTTNPPIFKGNQTATTYDTGTMDTNTIYYWRIDEKNPGNTTIGDVWSFITIVLLPGQASNPSPPNGVNDVSIYADISWTTGSFTTSHDVYFGTTNPPPFKVNQTGTTYDTGIMDTNTAYYWRIDEKNSSGTTPGILWSLTTGSVGDINDANLVAWWKFDEGAGTTAYDSAGENDGNLINGPAWTTGLIGGALTFDGIDDYIKVPDSSSLDVSGTFTFAFWVYADTSVMPSGAIISKDGTGDSSGAYNVYVFSDGSVGYENNNLLPEINTGPNVLSPGTWNHVAITFNNSASPKMRIYINGIEKVSGSPPAPSVLSTYLLIGRRGSSPDSWYFNSELDNVRIYNRALYEEEVDLLYQQGQ